MYSLNSDTENQTNFDELWLKRTIGNVQNWNFLNF